MFDNSRLHFFRVAALCMPLFLSACSKSFVVTSEVPAPLIEKMPVTAKLVYSDEFKRYVYSEVSNSRALERVDFGSAQVGLFEQVFDNLFSLVGSDEDDYDLKIEPHILDFQYSAPSETKINMYEIWLKYRLRVTDSTDSEIADWVVKGYGKTPTSMLGSQLAAFNTASNVALRDIGAQLALGFPSQPSIERYLSGDRSGLKPPKEPVDIESEDEAQANVDRPGEPIALSEEVAEVDALESEEPIREPTEEGAEEGQE